MTDDVIIELIAPCDGCNFGTGNLAQRMQVETIDASQEETPKEKAQQERPHVGGIGNHFYQNVKEL